MARADIEAAIDQLVEEERSEAAAEERSRWEAEVIRIDIGVVGDDGQPMITAYGDDMETRAEKSLMDLMQEEADHISGHEDVEYGWTLAARLRQALYLIEAATEEATVARAAEPRDWGTDPRPTYVDDEGLVIFGANPPSH